MSNNEEMLRMGRYREKTTGKFWECTGYGTSIEDLHAGINRRVYHIRPIEDKNQQSNLTKEEIEARFEYAPFEKPVFKIEEIEVRRPIQIKLYCPECGSLLKVKGGALLSSPLQYEHVCSNKECHYHTRTSSVHSWMFALVTDEQEKCINDGTFSSLKCGEVIEISEKEAAMICCKKN